MHTTSTTFKTTAAEAVARHSSMVAHPGELLAEVLEEGLHMTVAEAARQLGVTRQQLHRVLARHSAVTPAMALRLGRLCGNGPRLWLAMQADWDLAHAREQLGEALERVPEYRGG